MNQHKCICAENARKAFDRRTRCYHCNPPVLRGVAAVALPESKPALTNAVSRKTLRELATA